VDKRSFDQSFVIAIFSGGIVFGLSSILDTWYRFSITQELSTDTYRDEINLAIFVGLPIMLFALFYAIFTLRKKQFTIDKIWEDNHKSVVKHCLSLIDDDFTVMNWVFQKLESENFDFSRDSDTLTLGILNDVDYSSVKERFDEIPLLKNALGFITYDQYMAIYDYLRYSAMFIDLLDKQNYQKSLLSLRKTG